MQQAPKKLSLSLRENLLSTIALRKFPTVAFIFTVVVYLPLYGSYTASSQQSTSWVRIWQPILTAIGDGTGGEPCSATKILPRTYKRPVAQTSTSTWLGYQRSITIATKLLSRFRPPTCCLLPYPSKRFLLAKPFSHSSFKMSEITHPTIKGKLATPPL